MHVVTAATRPAPQLPPVPPTLPRLPRLEGRMPPAWKMAYSSTSSIVSSGALLRCICSPASAGGEARAGRPEEPDQGTGRGRRVASGGTQHQDGCPHLACRCLSSPQTAPPSACRPGGALEHGVAALPHCRERERRRWRRAPPVHAAWRATAGSYAAAHGPGMRGSPQACQMRQRACQHWQGFECAAVIIPATTASSK